MGNIVLIELRLGVQSAGLAKVARMVIGRAHDIKARLLAATSLMLLALLSKESALLAPFYLLGLDLGRFRRLGHPVRYLAIGAAVALYLQLRSQADLSIQIQTGSAQFGALQDRLFHVGGVYSKIVLWPWPLTPARHLDYLPDLNTVLLPMLALTALFALGAWKGRDRALVWVGLSWALLAFAPSLAATVEKSLLGERYLYLPMAGLSLALAAAVHRIPRLPVLGLALLAAIVIQFRLPQWENGRTVWEAAHEAEPTPYTAGGLAWYLHRDATQGTPDKAQSDADLRASLPLLEMALTGTPPYRNACPLAVLAYARAQDWDG